MYAPEEGTIIGIYCPGKVIEEALVGDETIRKERQRCTIWMRSRRGEVEKRGRTLQRGGRRRRKKTTGQLLG